MATGVTDAAAPASQPAVRNTEPAILPATGHITTGAPLPLGGKVTPGGGRSDLAFSAIVPVSEHDTVPDDRIPTPHASRSYHTPSRRTPVSTPPPPGSWGRYESLKRIGAGGMGTVYKAIDPRLNRPVALKFIRDNDPSLIQRFIWEAQAQARVEHPHVCKVYEVGDIDGIPYIAMQYIDGEPLSSAAHKMPLEQRVRVIVQVAEGLHAAHKLGLIHRDIKPANILIERTPEGAYCPYLVDFGLAREIAPEGRTVFGMEGTPAYMSPEQVAGNVSKLDRRTDVYSLGATMYELLTGRPPFDEGGVLNILRQIANEPPRPLRDFDKVLPVDLEAIVLKCLEKEPPHRYESARALAEDLERYLSGEPILARRVSWLQVLLKKAKKYKLVVALSLAVFMMLMASSVLALRAKVAAARQAERAAQVGALAQSLGQDVKEMELFMRYVYALPLHDTIRERDIIRERMKQIEGRMEATRGSLGNLVEGPGHYALGRGYLTLQEPERAVFHLERAFLGGYTAPEAAFAIGQAHGTLYRQGMDKARRIVDKKAREVRQKALAEQHLGPALQYLKQSAGATLQPALYTVALIALYENRFQDALKAAELAFEQSPWLYEAKKLEGEIFFTRAEASHEKGNREDALIDYRRAIESYQRATTMVTSDPTVYEAEAEAWIQVIVIEEPRGSDVEEPFARAIQACDSAIRANPRRGSSYVKKAQSHVQVSFRRLSSGADPRPDLRKAIEASQQAMQWDVPDETAHGTIGTSYLLIAVYEDRLALDTRPPLQNAIEHMKKAIALNPNSSWRWSELGAAYTYLAIYHASHGLDPLPWFQLGVDAVDNAIEINPNDRAPYVNRGFLYALQAQYELDHGQSPEDSLDQAIDTLEASLAIATGSYQRYNNLGLAYLIKSRYEISTKQNADMSLLRALQSFRMALQTNPEDVEAHQGEAAVLTEMALIQMDRRANAEDTFLEARTILRGLLATNPSNAQTYLALGQLDLLAARWAIERRGNPTELFGAALISLVRTLELNSNGSTPHRILAELHLRQGEWALSQGLRVQGHIDAGLSAIDKSLAIDSTIPASLAIQGALYLLHARIERDASTRHELAGRAQTALQKALEANPFLRRDYEPLLIQAQQLL